MTVLGVANEQKVVAAGPSPVAGYVVTTVHATASASAVSYGQLLTTFRRAGVSKVSLDGSLQRYLCYALRLGVSRT